MSRRIDPLKIYYRIERMRKTGSVYTSITEDLL